MSHFLLLGMTTVDAPPQVKPADLRLPDATITHEIADVLEATALRHKLIAERGLIFRPRERKCLLPQVDIDKTSSLAINDAMKTGVAHDVEVLYSYLSGQLIADNMTEQERSDWCEQMLNSKDKDLFIQVYYAPNQFRSNKITSVISALTAMARYDVFKDGELAYYCEQQSEQMLAIMHGKQGNTKKYTDMTTEEKVSVVRDVEDRILGVLQKLPQQEGQTPQEVFIS